MADETDLTVLVKYNCPNLRQISKMIGAKELRLNLKPGVNAIALPTWEAFFAPPQVEHPTIAALISSRKLEVIRTVEGLPTEGLSFRSIGEGEARSVIAHTFDIKILRNWLMDEQRPAIQGLLKDQIATMEA